jgi:phosphoribosylglycinamide formyltransferase-1
LKAVTDPGARGKLKLALLISGRGSNMTAIARACAQARIDAVPVVVVSDRGDAPGLAAAAALGLNTVVIEAARFDDRAAFEAALTGAIERSGADLIVLAGFMRILSAPFAQRYAGRLLNIHPSLLPRYKGLDTHGRVLRAGEREHGASVHFVTAELDGGPLICQARVPVRPDDTEQTLAARVIAQEHRIYPLAIGLIADGRLELQGSTVVLDGQPLRIPITPESSHGAHV